MISKAERGGKKLHAAGADDPREGKRVERSTGNRAEQRAGGLRGISTSTRKTTLTVEVDGEKTVVAKFDPPNHALFAGKTKTRKRGRK